uniref:DNA repair protein RecN n=1 Tax=uncultured delta proteobacterium HF0200_39L23 TaxID=710832 RepID=E0XXZ0_9DELT|nr:ATPase involved in DNA repair [uncultured delta proteobacterium HF0200_39L23]
MLIHLKIRNFATIKELEVDFGPGFSILTGETGAGKSILIDAIMLLRGERGRTSLVRSGEDQSEVEAVLSLERAEGTCQILEESGIEVEDEMIIRCLLSNQGRLRRFVNGVSVTADYLKTLTRQMITIHGQHEHQNLLQTSSHLDFLDGFAGLHPLREKVGKIYHDYMDLADRVTKHEQNLNQRTVRITELNEVIDELQELALESGEEEHLLQETKRLSCAEKLIQLLSDSKRMLSENEMTLMEQMEFLLKNIQESSELDPSCAPMLEELEKCFYQLEDFGRTLQKKCDLVEINPERLSFLNDRLNRIQRLQRKYSLNHSDDLCELLKSAEKEQKELLNLEENSQMLEEQKENALMELKKNSRKLSAKRRKISTDLDDQIIKQLQLLGMEKAQFQTRFNDGGNIDEIEWSEKGIDHVEFMLSVNPGQNMKSLTQVASGGELSRTMLALKTVLQTHDLASVMIFDEVDTGISGRVAEMVGKKLRNLGFQQQTLCVTHLPQIAAFSETHYVVKKQVLKDETYTEVLKMNTPEEKAQEIAQLIGGREITEKTFSVAYEMLEQAQNTIR